MKTLEERVNALEQEAKAIKAELAGRSFKGLNVGDTFELTGLTWKILDITDNGYVCLADRLKDDRRFGSNNNWTGSGIRSYLNGDFYKMLCEEIGEEKIVKFERDLLSLDGQKEYGKCEDMVSIISFDEYRKYRELIPNAGYYWWTLTPDSTACNGDKRFIRVVSPSGYIGIDYYDITAVFAHFVSFHLHSLNLKKRMIGCNG